MNLNLILKRNKIESLTYNSSSVELPMAALVDFDFRKILRSPPSNTSHKTQKELDLISYATLHRTRDDYDLIFKMDEDIDSFYIRFLNFHQLTYPQSYINEFYSVVEPILMNTKNYWNRPRPVQLAKLYGIDIEEIVTDTIDTASYPSGHTVYSKLVANILKKIYPKFSKNFDNIVDGTAEARFKQGVHYPSDNKASIAFANYVYEKLSNKI